MEILRPITGVTTLIMKIACPRFHQATFLVGLHFQVPRVQSGFLSFSNTKLHCDQSTKNRETCYFHTLGRHLDWRIWGFRKACQRMSATSKKGLLPREGFGGVCSLRLCWKAGWNQKGSLAGDFLLCQSISECSFASLTSMCSCIWRVGFYDVSHCTMRSWVIS